MRTVALAFTLAAVLLALPAWAENSGDQDTSSSGGVLNWVANTVSGVFSSDQTADEEKQPAQNEEAKSGGEPKPMAVPDDGMPDKDAYKPDAGEAPQ